MDRHALRRNSSALGVLWVLAHPFLACSVALIG